MSTDLTLFSEWTLALLPRLFIYPGGLWLLVVLLWLRFAARGPAALSPSRMAKDLLKANLLSVAIAWGAVALLPLPGAGPLMLPLDRLALAGMLALSLVADVARTRSNRAAIGAAITLATIAPLAGKRALLGALAPALADWLSLLAVAAGLIALAHPVEHTLAREVRWLAWFGLAATPVWALFPSQGIILPTIIYAVAIPLVAGASRVVGGELREEWVVSATWGLGVLSLLAALAR